MAISPDSQVLASWSFIRGLDFWEIPSGRHIFRFTLADFQPPLHPTSLRAFQFTPDGQYVILAALPPELEPTNFNINVIRSPQHVFGLLFNKLAHGQLVDPDEITWFGHYCPPSMMDQVLAYESTAPALVHRLVKRMKKPLENDAQLL